MCGYCIEGAFVLDFVAHEDQGEDWTLDNNWVEICLQETKDLLKTADNLKSYLNFEPALPVAFCRTWEKMLKKEYNKVKSALDFFSNRDKKEILLGIKEREPFRLTKIIGDEQFYKDNDSAERFFQQKEKLIEVAEEKLSWYCDW